MATDYLIPTTMELKAIEQDLLPRLTMERPVFDFFPISESDDSVVAWEQLDNFKGLQAVRGIGGAPSKVIRGGVSRYVMEPGSLVMERKMLLGIKERAERLARESDRRATSAVPDAHAPAATRRPEAGR